MLKVWNMVLVALAFELSVFGTFLTRSGVVNSIHSFAKSPIGGWFLAFVVISSLFSRRADPVAAAAAEGAHEARVGALARGDVPLQQPAARRALPDDALGRDLPDPHAALQGRDAHDRPSVLRLLPARVRPAAAAADGDRPADRVAARRASRALAAHARVADRDRRRRGVVLLAARRRLVDAGPDRVHVLGVRARDDRRRARPRHARDRLAVRSSSPATAAATAATSCTPRSCCSRSGSPARARTAARVEQRARARPEHDRRGLHAHLSAASLARTTPQRVRDDVPCSTSPAAGSGTITSGDRPVHDSTGAVARGRDQDRLAARARIST